jgi:hypothetical protein
MSHTELQGTPFPVPDPSIVNTFLRITAFSPKKDIFTMRPNKLTRCISKTNVSNEYRIDNYATIYKLIHEIKEKHIKATNHQFTNKAKLCMRIHPADIPPKRGEIFQKLLLETENLEWV